MKINLVDCFESTVRKKETEIAVKHKEENITFWELKQKALIAGTILSDIISDVANHPVAVFLPKEINAVIADLGIIYSANPFMNLDVKTPVERIMNILELVQPVAVVTNEKYRKIFSDITIPILSIDEINWQEQQADVSRLCEKRVKIIDTDPFCLINTSGSTGTPKGVVLNYRSFFDFIKKASII